jgi:hypothetical protein
MDSNENVMVISEIKADTSARQAIGENVDTIIIVDVVVVVVTMTFYFAGHIKIMLMPPWPLPPGLLARAERKKESDAVGL